ncbi:MAG: hypothetical protein AB2669_08060 [Candidatus Thiodiazotropha endolucinida]|nr:hypothetical protein [Candidatus Thiodiazotropha taylori]MCW4250173.1 hypothetical protein [Candidatus Thiodiazotropha endolucinida]MCG7883558.1 hypothetical protein [Candidatus Thiodiazotropha taylori]MCG8058707.1 hypothetical protein [Candidatus Thiodiazotropha taylori]MCG8104598.1 hypothetical protein [Candidatus Thiodiazotropha taylori]
MIPKTGDMTALAHWMNETASELIQDVMAMHTANLLKAMKGLVEERDDALRKVEIARQALEGIANDGTATKDCCVVAKQALQNIA